MRCSRAVTVAVSVLYLGCFVSACTNAMNRGSIVSESWGTADGKPVELYTLENEHGMRAKVTNYGGILTELHVPGRDGETADVVLGFDSLERYLEGHPYFGAIVGREANRTAGARFTLNGQTYELAANDGNNHLHGGEKGFDKRVWDAKAMETKDGPAVKLTYTSPDGEEGYPGTVEATVVYTLTNANELRIDMFAETDQPTPIDLTNHTYWNLAGHGGGEITDHVLELNASHYTPVNDELIPTGEVKAVAGTPFDFREAKPIGRDMGQVGGDPGGYDHNFAVDGEPLKLRKVATVTHPGSGRTMHLYANMPGVQLYTGNFLGGIEGKGGATYGRHEAFCLETQFFPDAINQDEFVSPVLNPDQTYHHTILAQFWPEE